MEPVKIKIDHEKLVQALNEKGWSSRKLSIELGMAEGYVQTVHKRGDMYPIAMVKLMGVFLGKDIDYFKHQEDKQTASSGSEWKILENIFQECKKIQESIQQIAEIQEVLSRKANANTIQLEKLKESVAQLAKSDLDKAMEFLKAILAGGRMEGSAVLLEADSAGIKRSDLMKAKKELGITVETSGYNKNQKSWWYLVE